MSEELAREMIADVTAGILVLRLRDGVDITAGQAIERARNIVAGLVANYEIRRLGPAEKSQQGETT